MRSEPRRSDDADDRTADLFRPGVSCGHCRGAITAAVEKLAGVASVEVDLDAKRVRVIGERLDDAAIRAAIDEAGYDVG